MGVECSVFGVRCSVGLQLVHDNAMSLGEKGEAHSALLNLQEELVFSI